MAKKNRFKPRYTGSALNNELSGRTTYEKPKFDEQGNKIDPNKQEVIAGGLPFQAAFNPASLSISNRAAMADGGFINQIFGKNSTLNKYIDKGKSFLGLDSDISDSPNVGAAMDKKPIESISGNNNIYSSRIANQNDVTSDTRYIAPNPTKKPVDPDTGTSSNSSDSDSTPTPEVRPRKQYNLMSPTMIGGLEESATGINIPTADEMKASGKKSSDKRMKLYDDSINTSKSRNRMGLFGNYGKDVTIKKTSNEVTGKVNREKFVDGKLVKSRFNNQEFKASKSKGNKNARQNRKNR